jgi:hypothetical protein
MNWFERYGIVGMFFIAMTAMWFFCFFPDSHTLFYNTNTPLVKYIVWICGLSFLPIGYLIMICSQLFYYRKGNKEHIHCKYWKDLPEKIKTKIQTEEKEKELEFTEKEQKDEVKIEAVLTYYDRKYIKPLDINQFLSTFATKRYDVISINNGFILAIPLSLVFAISLELIILKFDLKELVNLFSLVPVSVWVAIIVAISSWVILYKSKIIMREQILEIGKRKLRDIK